MVMTSSITYREILVFLRLLLLIRCRVVDHHLVCLQIKNLRSQVSRQAIGLLTEMYSQLKRVMDPVSHLGADRFKYHFVSFRSGSI